MDESWGSRFSTPFDAAPEVEGRRLCLANAAAIEVNQVWNFSNATSYKAARPFGGPPKWMRADSDASIAQTWRSVDVAIADYHTAVEQMLRLLRRRCDLLGLDTHF
jgi:hypothetical protein